ncbi:TetR/AcrR family transcriptional regulator [Actinophytocola algeriensis]|uniref:AcrR family transcriptional regulator n=1 Tax=Actinophytocola algeriensis TaxID=1768010 RepID=A0A7W7Q9R9_9PSEU|nr:TetR/AcrR family transcriptional regulator [Actinophytocola algeriensis]MBB4909289.1 AcrR family transcriptional regulator [Actinophytocola algeriensis]MBE1475279.1 AcrR family transcriptional regulator [Actinophytocola algeriensis]
MPRKSDARERMVRSAAVLLREHGAGATSIDRVLAHSGAPRGSVYHHFPGGRTQLIEEAVALAGDFVAGLIEAAARAGDPVAAIDRFVELWRTWLADSDFKAGCPIVAVTVANDSTRLAAGVFGRWADGLAASFRTHGVPDARARRLALFVIAAVEGAVVMCRAERSLEPLEAVTGEIHELLVHTLRD